MKSEQAIRLWNILTEEPDCSTFKQCISVLLGVNTLYKLEFFKDIDLKASWVTAYRTKMSADVDITWTHAIPNNGKEFLQTEMKRLEELSRFFSILGETLDEYRLEIQEYIKIQETKNGNM